MPICSTLASHAMDADREATDLAFWFEIGTGEGQPAGQDIRAFKLSKRMKPLIAAVCDRIKKRRPRKNGIGALREKNDQPAKFAPTTSQFTTLQNAEM